MTRYVLIVMPKTSRFWQRIVQKALDWIVREGKIRLRDDVEGAAGEQSYAIINGHPAARQQIDDTLPELARSVTEAYQSFLRLRVEMNRLSQYLSAHFRGQLPDLSSPADQAIALLGRLKPAQQ